jgi:hypothetical protein
MIIRILLAAVIITVAWFGIRWLQGHSSQHLRHTLFRFILYIGIAAVITLALTGRLHWLVAVAASMVPFIQRLAPLLRYVPFARQAYRHYQSRKYASNSPPPDQASSVSARFIQMTLNHSDGSIDGVILEGPYRQRRLSELGLEQLLECLEQWQHHDDESVRLLSAYLDQTYGNKWRQANGSGSTADPNGGSDGDHQRNGMTEDEALAILGLNKPASREAVVAAHRRLMQKLHPDRGGSNYLAVKINQAKDLLLDPDDQSVH